MIFVVVVGFRRSRLVVSGFVAGCFCCCWFGVCGFCFGLWFVDGGGYTAVC